MNTLTGNPVKILLVEDNPGDVILTKEAFAEGKINNQITVARDGEEAIKMLKKEDGFKNAERPDLILLDLNMPKKDGRDVLAEIKQSADLKRIPVIILTSSKAETDILKTYDLHANSYLVKPVDYREFTKVVSAIENFWFTIVELPKA